MKQVDISIRARRLILVLCLALITGSVACQSTTTGYEPVGTPELSFDEAKTGCEKASAFKDSSGESFVNWNKFETCMKPKGWARP